MDKWQYWIAKEFYSNFKTLSICLMIFIIIDTILYVVGLFGKDTSKIRIVSKIGIVAFIIALLVIVIQSLKFSN